MNIASTNFGPSAFSVRRDWASRFLSTGIALFDRWYARRMTARYLQSVDDRVLRDIGISRSEILSVMYAGHGRVRSHAGGR